MRFWRFRGISIFFLPYILYLPASHVFQEEEQKKEAEKVRDET